MSSFAAKVAETFLLWPKRLLEYGVCGHLDVAPRSSDLSEAFSKHLRRTFPAYHEDDLKNAAMQFLSSWPDLRRWYEGLCAEYGLSVSFFDAQPAIGQDSYRCWAQLIRRIDPDSILTHALVEHGQEESVLLLAEWATLVASGDHELRRLLGRHTLIDAHVHLSGCDPIAGLWQRLVAGRTRLERLDRYRASKVARLESIERMELQSEVSLLGEGLSARGRLLEELATDAHFRARTTDGARPVAPHLSEERALLTWAWSCTKAGNRKVEADLDRYLLAKNCFISNHHQIVGARPGLRSFREYLKQGEEWVSSESRRIRRDRIVRRVAFATECPQLRTIELRIAPFLRVNQYVEFFKTWEVLVRRWEGRKLPRAAFIIHFIRPMEADGGEGRLPFEGLRRRLDRQSAALHLFCRTRRDLARHIVGIDVANLERDCPPEVFSPFLRLLRGDCAGLAEDECDAVVHQCWLRLAARRDAWHPVDLPQLYLTYHAGEDFYHPLQGMRDMSEVIEGAKMRAGDRIGHGLAAGWDLAAFEMGRGADLQLPAGVLWDALIWALDFAEREGIGDPQGRRKLADSADELGERIYGCTVPLRAATHLQRLRHQLVPRTDKPATQLALQLRLREFYDPECRAARRKLQPFPYSTVLRTLFEAVQEDFVRNLARRRITIELNPTSNLLISGVSDLRQHPFFRLRKIARSSLSMTINTDDPGVFATRIDAEYAVMLDAMLANGIPKHECFEILEQILEATSRSTFVSA